MAFVGPKPMSQCQRSPTLGGRGEGFVLRSAARRDAISPGLRVGLRSKSWIVMVGWAESGMVLCIFGLLRKPILLRRRSWVRLMLLGVCEGTLANGRGLGLDRWRELVLEFSETVELVEDS